MSSALRRYLILLLLLPQLAVASLGNGLVLCAAPGGHLQVEIGNGSCCESDSIDSTLAKFSEPSENGPVNTLPSCPSCEDFIVSVDTARPEQQLAYELAPTPTAWLPAFLSEPQHSLVAIPPTVRARGTRHLTVLRTTVIRC